jgi:hypothetical protein
MEAFSNLNKKLFVLFTQKGLLRSEGASPDLLA